MFNRKHTLDLSTLLTNMAIDLKVELEILDCEAPTPQDHHAALMAAWRLHEAEVKATNVAVESQQLFITQRFNVKGTPQVSLEFTLQFDRAFDMSLVQTNVIVRGVTMANSKDMDFPQYLNLEKKGLEFTDIDLGMFVPVPALMAPFVQGMWRFVFNDNYSPDWVHMAALPLDFLPEKKDVFVNGHLYAILPGHHLNLTDPESETVDLVGLAARLFLQNYPQNKDVTFVVGPTAEREPELVLCVEVDEQ